MRGVVVTGLGVTAALGEDSELFWAGMSAAAAIPGPAEVLAGRIAYAHPEPGFGPDRVTRFAIRAARAALRNAGLTPGDIPGCGVIVGSGLGSLPGYGEAPGGVDGYRGGVVPGGADGYRGGVVPGGTDGRTAGGLDGGVDGGLDGGAAPTASTDAAPDADSATPFLVAPDVADALGLLGPVHSVGTACSAGVYAVALAAQAIADGSAEVMLAGGSEALSPVAYGGLERLGLLDPELCRPFDRDRRGMVPGEGSAFLVLESAGHAARRGLAPDRVLARAEGFGESCDAYHATAPEPGGEALRRAYTAALADAGRTPADIGAVVPHRAGVAVNDDAEVAALAQVLGGSVPAYGLKAVLGHTGGAAGAFACAAAVLLLARRLLPPTAHVREPDADCPLPVHTAAPRPLAARSVLVSGTGFGGNHAALVLTGSAA